MSERGMSERPLSRSARQALVQQVLESTPVASQTELADLLAERGISVSQGTISKDLVEIRAVRRRGADGSLRYVIGEEPTGDQASLEKLIKLCQEVLLDAQASANLVVTRTPPGAAQYFASAIDKAAMDDVLGTIAGDDTVLIISTDADGGASVAEQLLSFAAGQRPA